MKGCAGVAAKVLLAALQSVVYVYLVRYHSQNPRRWCTRDWMDIDCLDEAGKKAETSNGTELKLVLPSFGQSGTTSVIQALREIGLRAFHADDYSVFQKSLMWNRADYALWSRGVSRCRMDAISLEPTVDVLPMALAMSPKAKFLITWRPFPAWRRSSTSTRAKEIRWGSIFTYLMKANRLLPWFEWCDNVFGNFERVRRSAQYFPTDMPVTAWLYRMDCGGYTWPDTDHLNRGVFKGAALEEAYLGHMNEIRMLVPKDRLFEFDVRRHGWAELEDFLGIDTGRRGTPFPHPRSGHLRVNEPILENNFLSTGWSLAVYCALHSLNTFLAGIPLRLVLCWLPWLLALAAGYVVLPLHGARACCREALAESPLVAILDGAEPETVVPLGEVLVSAGVRALAVPLEAHDARRTLRRLRKALPKSIAVGGALARDGSGAWAVYCESGQFVISQFTDAKATQLARGMGLVSISGVCTPTEAAMAASAGASGVVAVPELVSPGGFRTCLKSLRPGVEHALVWGELEPKALEEYWVAGITGVAVGGASLYRPSERLAKTAERAEALLSACRAARRAAAARS